MGGTRQIISIAVLAVAAGLLAGSVNAGNGWHTPAQLDLGNSRLKRSTAPLPAPLTSLPRWRSPAQADALGSRANTWRRTTFVRPRTRIVHTQQAAAPAESYDDALVAALNQVRSRHGLPALRVSRQLENAAERHTRNMARLGFFAHESADGSAFWKRVDDFYSTNGFGYWAVGENLIWGSPDLSVDEAVQGWMESPGHRANILSREWREFGLFSLRDDAAPGVYGRRKVTIITCDFGVRR